MDKKVIAFDLDETLTETRTPITEEMTELLKQLLDKYQVCVISGGNFEQFQKQLLDHLQVEPRLLASLHIMPTCGTRYYKFDVNKNEWREVYAENLSNDEKEKIKHAMKEVMIELGHPLKEAKGVLIDDRGSQITYQALGLGADTPTKKSWDPNGVKKREIRDLLAPKIPEFEVRTGGTTSVDVTPKGMDKAYGMKKLMSELGINKDEILFVGDRIWEGGNDYPVKQMGIETVNVNGYEDTPNVVREILTSSR